MSLPLMITAVCCGTHHAELVQSPDGSYQVVLQDSLQGGTCSVTPQSFVSMVYGTSCTAAWDAAILALPSNLPLRLWLKRHEGVLHRENASAIQTVVASSCPGQVSSPTSGQPNSSSSGASQLRHAALSSGVAALQPAAYAGVGKLHALVQATMCTTATVESGDFALPTVQLAMIAPTVAPSQISTITALKPPACVLPPDLPGNTADLAEVAAAHASAAAIPAAARSRKLGDPVINADGVGLQQTPQHSSQCFRQPADMSTPEQHSVAHAATGQDADGRSLPECLPDLQAHDNTNSTFIEVADVVDQPAAEWPGSQGMVPTAGGRGASPSAHISSRTAEPDELPSPTSCRKSARVRRPRRLYGVAIQYAPAAKRQKMLETAPGTGRGEEHRPESSTLLQQLRQLKEGVAALDVSKISRGSDAQGFATVIVEAVQGSSVQDAIERLEHIFLLEADLVQQNSEYGSDKCKRCNMRLALDAYQAPQAHSTHGPVHCAECRHKNMARLRLASRADIAKLILFLEAFRISGVPLTVLPELHELRPKAKTSTLPDFQPVWTQQQLQAELNELAPEERRRAGGVEPDSRQDVTGRQLLQMFLDGKYVKGNVYSSKRSKLAQYTQLLQSCFGIAAARGYTDNMRSAMFLLGRAGTGTRIHCDWTQAVNLAVAILLDGEDKDAVAKAAVARWLFIVPGSEHIVLAWMRKHLKSCLPSNANAQPLTAGQMKKLEDALPGCVLVVDQLSGQEVYPMPGWMHCVVNLRPCIKLAFDFYDPSIAAMYVRSWRQIASKHTAGGLNADDYMAVLPVTLHAITCIINEMALGIPAVWG